MTDAIRMPGNLDVPIRLFGQFSIVDLIRLSAPTLIGIVIAGLPSAGLGLVVGATWYLWRPCNQPLDHHLRHSLRWHVLNRRIEGTDLRRHDAAENSSETAVQTQSGAVVGVIEVDPTNLDLKSRAEQDALHSVYQHLLETPTYPIQIHSKQHSFDLDSYIDHLRQNSSRDSPLRDDYISYCQDHADTRISDTRHYLTVRVEPDHQEYLNQNLNILLQQAKDRLPEPVGKQLPTLEKSNTPTADIGELDSRCQELIDAITSADLTAERVTGHELNKFASTADRHQPQPTPHWTAQPALRQNEYRRTLYITEFPTALSLGWIRQLLRTDGYVDITQTIHPQKPDDTVETLDRTTEKLGAEISSLVAAGHTGTNKLESLLDDAEWFLDLLADRQAQPVDYGCYITVHDTDQTRCETTFEQLKTRLDTMHIEYQQPVFRTDQAYRTQSPLHPDTLNETLLMPSTSAAAGFPFTTHQTSNQGVLHGIDSYDGTPVLADRFNWSSHAMARMGMVGSGKSYATKLELLRSDLVYDDLQIIVIDPKQEYQSIIRELGGDSHVLEPDADYSFEAEVTGFTVADRGDDANTEQLVEITQQVYQVVSQDQRKTLVVIDEARILLNDDTGRQVLNQFVLEGRDTNTAITLVTQNASHFTHSRKGREILDNTPGKLYMRHDRVPDSVVDYFDLSRKEQQQLYQLKTGTDHPYSQALLRISNREKTQLRIEGTDTEHRIIKRGEAEE